MPCRVYGMRGGPEADQVDGNLEYRPRSGDGFVEDLRTARGVVTGGGFSLLSEAVYLGKPVLSIPLRGQFEQLMNARYLERDGYGLCAEEVDAARSCSDSWTGSTGSSRPCRAIEQDGNSVAVETVERLAAAAAAADRKAVRAGRRRGPEARVNRAAIGAGAATVGAVGGAIWCGQYPTAQVYGATICHGSKDRKLMALTYDDGPNPRYTPTLMEILDRYNAKATFFSIGQWAEREPGLLREMHAAGPRDRQPHLHAPDDAAAHGRRRSGTSSRAAGRRSRRRGSQFSTVDGAWLMRPPYGRRRPATLRTMREEGYVPVTWSITVLRLARAPPPSARSRAAPRRRARAT